MRIAVGIILMIVINYWMIWPQLDENDRTSIRKIVEIIWP